MKTGEIHQSDRAFFFFFGLKKLLFCENGTIPAVALSAFLQVFIDSVCP